MAQWSHQYSGLTHNTKVADCEATLRKAVERYRLSDSRLNPPDFLALAARVLRARRKALGAALSDAEPGAGAPTNQRTERLRVRIEELDSGGVDSILREFSVPSDFLEQ